jgi:hypothetical protein
LTLIFVLKSESLVTAPAILLLDNLKISNEQLGMSNDKAGSRVCQALLSDPKARSKALFGYAGAERMCLHGKWLAGNLRNAIC